MTCVLIDFLAIGVTTDIAAVRHILDRYNHPALLMVDGVSSIASIPFKMDEWKVGMFSSSRKHFLFANSCKYRFSNYWFSKGIYAASRFGNGLCLTKSSRKIQKGMYSALVMMRKKGINV